MAKLKVKYVGPIREGLSEDINDGYLEFEGVTLFIGDQGSGKSTIAKLFSNLSWLEKALIRGEYSLDGLSRRSFKNILEYQNIHNYLSDQSFVIYEGTAYSIKYENGQLSAIELTRLDYSFPKVMYIPAERNLGSSLRRASSIRGLPAPLYTFLDEYEDAKEMTQGQHIDLPVSGTQFSHHSLNNTSYIHGEDYRINLVEASSGFQSMVPLFITTRYLSEKLNQEQDDSTVNISLSDKRVIEQELEQIAQRSDLSAQEREALTTKAEQLLDYKCLITVVEEPEQNLYPNSQKQLLYELLRYAHRREGDQLVITTHSLYWISYLSLCIKAHEVKHMIEGLPSKEQEAYLNQLYAVVPQVAVLDEKRLRIYELDVEGNINPMKGRTGLPSDDNGLYEEMDDSNEEFSSIIKLRSTIRNA